jgi:MFS superfamily sulfate permease-like transporter
VRFDSISGASGNFFTKLWHVLQHLPDVSVAPALTGILSLAAMLLLRHFAPAVPAALVVMAVATILIGLLGGEATGVHVAGHLPSGELTLGVLQGIALGVVLSILTLIYLTSHPKGAVLGQLPGTEAYRDIEHRPEACCVTGFHATTPAQRLNVSLRSFHPDVSVFPDRVVGSTCASSFSRIARRSLALRPAYSRCHQFVTR